MIPYFNTSGPCVPGDHYMLPPERRLGRVMELIEQRRYFTLHAGRQTGKTTSARWLVDHYNRGDRYAAVWVDIQTAREQPDPSKAFRTILNEFSMSLERDLPGVRVLDWEALLTDPATCILRFLRAACGQRSQPLIVLIDEADGLVGEAMVSFLTQLRRGYTDRSKTVFASSVALIGMREVRDYVLTAAERHAVSWLGTTSPFNITAEAQTLAPFTRDEVAELLGQHTAATGQRFEEEAADRIYRLSQGHPWLVNALADEAVRSEVPDRSVPVTAEDVESAKETIIIERRTHVDSLIARLHEPRVRKVIEPMLMGARTGQDVMNDDFAYVLAMGLIAFTRGRYEIANPIYREIIPRALSFDQQAQLDEETAWYVKPDGSLDMEKLLRAFQDFWRTDGHLAAEGFAYREAGPHLMLMAFLQRVVNAGGRVEREYGLGRGRTDLLVVWHRDAETTARPREEQRFVVELKVRRAALASVIKSGLEQTREYMDRCGADGGALVIFDRTKGKPWSKKIFRKVKKLGRKRVTIWGM